MSIKNRKMMYDKLVAEGMLSQDDGALEKEFGTPKAEPTPAKAAMVPPVKPKGKGKR